MTHQSTMDTIAAGRVIAIVRLPDLSNAVDITRALLHGGIRAVEFTLTNPAAPNAIEEVRAALPEFSDGRAVVGAGTVLSDSQAEMVIAAGAQFIVAPNTNMRVIEACKAQGVAAIPGAFTPTEIQAAWEAGASAVKVFPIRSLGPQYIRDILNPLPHLRLIPTSAATLDNIAAFFAAGVFAVGVTSDLVSRERAESQDYAGLEALAREFIAAADNQ